MNKQKTLAFAGVVAGFLLAAIPAFAHAVVTPNQVGIAATQTFSLSVPTEKDGGTTTSVRLMIPTGLEFVTPVVQGGWSATVKSGPIPAGMKAPVADDGDVADSIPTEIDWTGGSIPSGEKAILQFTAQAPAQPGELDWKVYQGYADGSTVSWDLGPKDPQPKDEKGNPDFDNSGPYSKTMVINDLTAASPSMSMNMSKYSSSTGSNSTKLIALAALGLSVLALGMHFTKR